MLNPKDALEIAQPPNAGAELEKLQRESFSYFLHETNPDNGLVIDKTAVDWPASIAATGFALAACPVAVGRGFMPRAAAVAIVQLSRATNQKMIQNLLWAAGYNVIAIPLAAGALYAWGVLLSPAVGAALMAASTVIVAINARLLKIKR